MRENLTIIIHGLLSFLFLLCIINLVMELPRIQVSFACCEGIRIPYMVKI